MIQQLTLSLSGVKHEQEYMQVRDRVHRASKLHQFLYFKVSKNILVGFQFLYVFNVMIVF